MQGCLIRLQRFLAYGAQALNEGVDDALAVVLLNSDQRDQLVDLGIVTMESVHPDVEVPDMPVWTELGKSVSKVCLEIEPSVLMRAEEEAAADRKFEETLARALEVAKTRSA